MQELFRNLDNSKISLSYLGTFDDEITDKLIGISEHYLQNNLELVKLKNKVSFLIAECFQNIVRHKEPKGNTVYFPEEHHDFFQLTILEDRTALASCNLVADKYVKELEQKLIQVNSLNSDDLKLLYNEVLNNEGFSNKGGAGLGLIEMARKSGLPLNYLFVNTGDGFHQFFLSLEIIGKTSEAVKKVNINDINQFYNYLLNKNMMLVYKGDLSKDIIVPLVEMVQTNFVDAENISGQEKRSITVLIEALQNISKHGKSVNGLREGVFSLMQTNNSYTVEVGNTIEPSHQIILENELSAIKKMDGEQIRTEYKKRLITTEITKEGNCGLGLLEIAKHSEGNFDYNFTTPSSNSLFYTLKVNI